MSVGWRCTALGLRSKGFHRRFITVRYRWLIPPPEPLLLFRQQAGDVVATPAHLAAHRWTLECLTTIPDSPDTDRESRVCRNAVSVALETDGTT